MFNEEEDEDDDTSSATLRIVSSPMFNDEKEDEELDDDEEEEDDDSAYYEPERPTGSLRSVILPAEVRAEIDRALALLQHGETIFQRWGLEKVEARRGRLAMNFYGPPGTGKTLAASAIAKRLRKRIVRINYAELQSMWIGETEKNVVKAFASADRFDAVLFFDEADAMLAPRVDDSSASSRWLALASAVLLTELDQFDGVVIFATNRAGAYDHAFRRRIQAHVEFRLPDVECRARLFRLMLPPKLPRQRDVLPQTLAEETEGMSGAEIREAVLGAAVRAAMRRGRARRVGLEDLRAEVARLRKAREDVGEDASL